MAGHAVPPFGQWQRNSAHSSPKDVDVIVARVRDKLGLLAQQRRLPVTVECSTGIAWSQNPPDTAEEFLREADRDMHERKARETERHESA